MTTIDIQLFIFYSIFKILPETVYKYSSLGDRLLYLIVIPHLILLLLLWEIVDWMIGAHTKFKKLFLIVLYVFFIYSGWYGTWFVSLSVIYWYYMVVAYVGIFFLKRFFQYSKIFTATYYGFSWGRKIRESFEKKMKSQKSKVKELEKKLKDINRQLQSLGAKISTDDKLPLEKNRNLQMFLDHLSSSENSAGYLKASQLLKEREEILNEMFKIKSMERMVYWEYYEELKKKAEERLNTLNNELIIEGAPVGIEDKRLYKDNKELVEFVKQLENKDPGKAKEIKKVLKERDEIIKGLEKIEKELEKYKK